MGAINSFEGEYRFLSNFYERPFWVGNRRWASAEHAYQAAKSLLPADWDAILSCRTPGQAKRMGMKPLISGERSEDEGLFVCQHEYWAQEMRKAVAHERKGVAA